MRFWLAFIISIFIASSALADTCRCLPRTPAEAYQAAHTVFHGRVTDVTPAEDRTFVVFQHIFMWKSTDRGQRRSGAVVVQIASNCNVNFEVGERYLVYGNWNEKGLITNRCMRTAKMDKAGEDMIFLQHYHQKWLGEHDAAF